MRVARAMTDRRTDEHTPRGETEPPRRVILPAGRIALLRFALVEVEQPTEEDRSDSFV